MNKVEIIKVKNGYILNVYDINEEKSYVHTNYQETIAHATIYLKEWDPDPVGCPSLE